MSAGVLILLLIIAIVLGVVLTQNSSTSSLSTSEEITKYADFPNGTVTLEVNSLSNGPDRLAPLRSEHLSAAGISVREDIGVAETGRRLLYVRLPDPNRAKRDTEVTAHISIRFGTEDLIKAVPLAIANKSQSGLRLAGTVPQDYSQIFEDQVRMPNRVCSGGICVVACLPTKDPVTRRYNMGASKGSVKFVYQTYAIPDRIVVREDGRIIFGSGCIGTGNVRSTIVQLNERAESGREAKLCLRE